MTEYTQAALLDLLRPDADKLKAEIVARTEFEDAFRKAEQAAARLDNDAKAAAAYSRLAALRLARDKQTAAVLDADKATPARDLSALNLVELQVLAYYTALAAGEVLPLEGCDVRTKGVVELLRTC